MKKSIYSISILIIILFSTCLILSCTNYVFANQDLQNEDEYENEDANNVQKIIKVGFYKWNGINMQDEEMNRSGYAYEYLMHLARYNNWQYDFIGYDSTWEESLEMLENNEIDLLCAMVKTDARSEQYLISELSMGTIQSILTTNKDNTRYYLNDKTYDYLKIGAVRKNATNEVFKNYASNHKIDFEFVYSPENNEHDYLLNALINNNIDGIFRTQFDITEKEKIILNFGSKEIHIAVNKDNNELFNELNASMTRLSGNESHLNAYLNKKYSKNHTHLNYTRDEIEFVNNNKSKAIRLGFIDNNKPFSWIEDNSYKGIFIELINLISVKTGLTFELVPISDKDLEHVEMVLSNYNLDGVIGFNNDSNLSEKLNLEISDSFMEYSYATLFYDFIVNNKVGIYKKFKFIDDPYEEYKYKEVHPNSTLYYFTTLDESSSKLEKKQITSIFIDEFSAQILMNQIYREDLNIKSNINYKIQRTIAIKNNMPKEIIMLINKGISTTSEDELSAIYEKVIDYAEDDYDLYDFWTSYGVVTLIFSIMLALVIWTNKYHRKVLYDKNLELISTNNQKNSFMARMSHDMRTPLTAIIGLSDLRLSDVKYEDDIEFYSEIKNSGLYLLDLVNDVLDIQKVDNGNIEFSYKINDIKELVDHIAKISNQRAKEKNIMFSLNCNYENINYAIFDSVKVRQILINILNNAVKYTPKGGSVSWNTYFKTIDDTVYMCHIISDTGIGMSVEFQEIMYNVFAREINKLSKIEGGAGLGLAITKNLVELMGGYIDCKSKLNKGTKFNILIPVKIPSVAELNKYKTNSQNRNFDKLRDKRILICEDVEINAKIINKLLSTYSIKCDHAINGKIGVEMTSKNNYDAIIMDIKMPIMDGLEAAKEIRMFNSEIPIIALSANAYAEDIKKSLEAGMNTHLSKPINNDILISTIYELIK